jgi:hypothetical protein
MKSIYFILIFFLACNDHNNKNKSPNSDTVENNSSKTKEETGSLKTKTYSNERFKDVAVQRTGEHSFLIKGKAQVFEATLSWVVEDGHEELKQGFEMTDAGAPEWGNFNFTVDVEKKRQNSTLTLVLFESSAKDGSRQFELPIVLY